jgi:glucosamine--fructose-6-phosphate aminotransferase (isomerizing)
MALAAGKARGFIAPEDEKALVHTLSGIPRLMRNALARESTVAHVAEALNGCEHMLYLGRGTSYVLALEGALKMKEISYIHAEGYAAGELKHGPIALVDKRMPVVIIAPHDVVFDKTMSNMHEVATRGGKIVLLTDQAPKSGIIKTTIIPMQSVDPCVAPFVYAVPLQLLAYHKAVLEGTDVDQPRNLAKSVTVE